MWKTLNNSTTIHTTFQKVFKCYFCTETSLTLPLKDKKFIIENKIQISGSSVFQLHCEDSWLYLINCCYRPRYCFSACYFKHSKSCFWVSLLIALFLYIIIYIYMCVCITFQHNYWDPLMITECIKCFVSIFSTTIWREGKLRKVM